MPSVFGFPDCEQRGEIERVGWKMSPYEDMSTFTDGSF